MLWCYFSATIGNFLFVHWSPLSFSFLLLFVLRAPEYNNNNVKRIYTLSHTPNTDPLIHSHAHDKYRMRTTLTKTVYFRFNVAAARKKGNTRIHIQVIFAFFLDFPVFFFFEMLVCAAVAGFFSYEHCAQTHTNSKPITSTRSDSSSFPSMILSWSDTVEPIPTIFFPVYSAFA